MCLGGYNHPSTAKLWSILTHLIISECHEIISLPESVPEHEFWPLYVDDENLKVSECPQYDSVKESHTITELKTYIESRI